MLIDDIEKENLLSRITFGEEYLQNAFNQFYDKFKQVMNDKGLPLLPFPVTTINSKLQLWIFAEDICIRQNIEDIDALHESCEECEHFEWDSSYFEASCSKTNDSIQLFIETRYLCKHFSPKVYELVKFD